PSYVVTPLQGIRNRAGSVTVTAVNSDSLSAGDRDAIAAADAAVVIAGLTQADEGEAHDRTMLGLSSAQEALIAAVPHPTPPTLVVLEGGRALTLGSLGGRDHPVA